MAELTIKPPVPRIRLYSLPSDHVSKYTKRSDLRTSIAVPHGLTNGNYGYHSGHLTDFLKGTNAMSLALSVGPSMFKDFSIKKRINAPSNWSATVEVDADVVNNKDTEEILEGAATEGAIGLCYFATGYEDVSSLSKILGWSASPIEASNTWFTDTPAAWTRRGMIGPTKVKINQVSNQTISMTLSGQSSLVWLQDTDHKNFGDGTGENWITPSSYVPGATDQRGHVFVGMVRRLFSDNCEFDPDQTNDDSTERKPTQIGRMLMYPRVTQAAFNRIKTDTNPADLQLKPGPGANVLKSLVEFATSVDCFVYDAGIDVVIDTATNSGMTLGKDVLATGDLSIGRPKRNRFETYHKDTWHDFSEVLDITNDILDEVSIGGISAEAIGSQEVWGVISGPPLVSRALHATTDPDKEDEDTTDDDDTEDDEDAAKPVPNIGKEAKSAIMKEQNYEEATKTIISKKGSAVIQTEAGHLIGNTIKLGENYDLDFFGLGSGKIGHLRNQILYEWAADSQGDTDTYAYTPGFSPIANILPGAGFKPLHVSETADMLSYHERRLALLEEVASARSTAIELAAAAAGETPTTPTTPGTTTLPSGTSQPTGGTSWHVGPFAGEKFAIDGGTMFWSSANRRIVAYSLTEGKFDAGSPFNIPTETLGLGTTIAASSPGVISIPRFYNFNSRRYTFTLGGSRLIWPSGNTVSLLAGGYNPDYNSFIGRLPNPFAVIRDHVYATASRGTGYRVLEIWPFPPAHHHVLRSSRIVRGSSIQSVPSSSFIPFPSATDGEHLYGKCEGLSNDTDTAVWRAGLTEGNAETFITFAQIKAHLPSSAVGIGISQSMCISSEGSLFIAVSYAVQQITQWRIIGFGITRSISQRLVWSDTNWNSASNRYELTYDKNPNGDSAHRNVTFPIDAYSRLVPDTGSGGNTILSYTEANSGTVGNIFAARTGGQQGFGFRNPTTDAVGSYAGVLTARVSGIGTLPPVSQTRNTWLNLIDSREGMTSAAAPPVVSPTDQTVNAYAATTGASEIATFLVSVPGVDNPRIVSEFLSGVDTDLWAVQAVAADGKFAISQTWATAQTGLNSSYTINGRSKHEQEGKTDSAWVNWKLEVNIQSGTKPVIPTTPYHRPRVNPSWTVPRTGNLTIGQSETYQQAGAFTFAEGYSAVSWRIRAKSDSLSRVSVTRPDDTDFTILARNTGLATIQISVYDGRSWSDVEEITRNITAAATTTTDTGWWIKHTGSTNAVPLNNVTIPVPENSPRTRIFENDEIYFAYEQSANRAIDDGNASVLAYQGNTGALVPEVDGIHSFSTASGTKRGYRFKFYSVGTNIDFESQNQARFRVEASVSRYQSGGTVYPYFSDQFYVTFTITNVQEPPVWTDGLSFLPISADGKLHMAANSGRHQFGTAGTVRDPEATGNSQLILRNSTALVGGGTSPVSTSWTRGSTTTPIGDGDLYITPPSTQQTAETTMQLFWYDGHLNSTTESVNIVTDAPTKITPTGAFSSAALTATIDENSAIGTQVATGTFSISSTNLQAVFGIVNFTLGTTWNKYFRVDVDSPPGDSNTATKVQTDYTWRIKVKANIDFESLDSAALSDSITATSAGSPNSESISMSKAGTITIRDVTELVRRNATAAPDHTFTITLGMAEGNTVLPTWDIDPSLYFQNDDPDVSRPVTYTHNYVRTSTTDTGIFSLADVTVGGKPMIRITPLSAYINGSPQSRDYEIHANQQGGVQSTPARGTITINPYAPRALRSHYPSPISFVHEYINATETSTDFEIASHYSNDDNRPVRFGFTTDFDQTASDSVAQYTFVTKADGTIIVRATRQVTYTPSTETFHTSRIVYVGTTDPASASVIPIYYGLTVTRPSS